MRRLRDSPWLGHLLSPNSGNSIQSLLQTGLPWAADNGAFSGFEEQRFVRLLDRISGQPGCLFVAAPDVVADARSTLECFATWQPVITACGLPVAFVAQDGQEQCRVPWARFRALFLGGTTEWKLSGHARKLARRAKALGKGVHMGRVNSRKRLAVAFDFGCDSVDGSGFSMFPDTRIPLGLRWIEELACQGQEDRFCSF